MNQVITSTGGGKRLSNIEALRLLCMLMVLNLHSFWGYDHGDGVWQALDFFRESTSICAVDCFILISGYFGIKWKYKSLFNLVFQMFFYSVGIYIVVVGVGVVEWNIKDFLMRFGCLFTHSWGFAISYVLLWFCSPALNALTERSTTKELFYYIIVYFAVLNFISVPRDQFFTYTLVYLIGRFLKKINASEMKVSAGFYWITTALIFGLVYGVMFKMFHITKAGVINGWPIGFLGYDYAAPLVILQAIFLFMVFAKKKFNSKFVNWCASSCFAIYLIHMHPTIKEIGYYTITENLYNYSVWLHILMLIGFMLTVFICSILLDQMRIVISNRCLFVVEELISLVPSKWRKVETYMPKLAKKWQII